MNKRLVALPFLALALIAAKSEPRPVAPATTVMAVPAEVAADPANKWTLELSNGGKVVIQLRPDVAPAHVERINTLARQGFYNGVIFHRVIEGFIAPTLPRSTSTAFNSSRPPDFTMDWRSTG